MADDSNVAAEALLPIDETKVPLSMDVEASTVVGVFGILSREHNRERRYQRRPKGIQSGANRKQQSAPTTT